MARQSGLVCAQKKRERRAQQRRIWVRICRIRYSRSFARVSPTVEDVGAPFLAQDDNLKIYWPEEGVLASLFASRHCMYRSETITWNTGWRRSSAGSIKPCSRR